MAEIFAKAICDVRNQAIQSQNSIIEKLSDIVALRGQQQTGDSIDCKRGYSRNLVAKDLSLCLHQPGDGEHMGGLNQLPDDIGEIVLYPISILSRNSTVST